MMSFALVVVCAIAAEPAHTNRLARESSPYLLQHAHNPVDWFPWGPEAFAKATKEKKLVFLSIGYSACHWCHVMERESFASADVAKELNANFVCIKVDREERPDVDQVYMAALQQMNARGGWPLSMFLTPEGKPIVGGTYWPREDREIGGKTVQGLRSILKSVGTLWQKQPDDVRKQADHYATATKVQLRRTGAGVLQAKLDRPLLAAAVDAQHDEYDPIYGGFGSKARNFQGTKFPTAIALRFLQSQAATTPAAAEMLERTLDRMARGGIVDHLAGGFHRYSTERTWTVPHFEKMLYDNAQLAEVYAIAFGQHSRPQDERVIRDTLAFVKRELTSPDGVFYAALDADSEHEEGKYYVWSAAELKAALKNVARADLFREVYGLDGEPNFEEKSYILTLPRPLETVAKSRKQTVAALLAELAGPRDALLAVRNKRTRPLLDTKVLTAWNGQMIAGYAVAGKALKEPAYLAAAEKAAEFLLSKHRTKDGRLYRTSSAGVAKLGGYLDDYAYLAYGLLRLHEATGNARWLTEATALTETMQKHFADDIGSGFYYTPGDGEKLFARGKDQYDGAQPSANSTAAWNLVYLSRQPDGKRFAEAARKSLEGFSGTLKENPTSLTGMAFALDLWLAPAK